jgi:alginate O-acetyltransferase complex protein AlgI
MLFNSYEFIFLFLPIVLGGYYLVLRHRGRMVFLTIMSYVFYGWWDYRFCALMFISTILDFITGYQVAQGKTDRARKAWVAVSLIGNLGLLGFFKYFDLFARTINAWAAWLGHTSPVLPLLQITLPVGISFYTFQSMSYTIDIYRGCAKPARGFWDFACYVSLFPQLVAGRSFVTTNWRNNWFIAPIRWKKLRAEFRFLSWVLPKK